MKQKQLQFIDISYRRKNSIVFLMSKLSTMQMTHLVLNYTISS